MADLDFSTSATEVKPGTLDFSQSARAVAPAPVVPRETANGLSDSDLENYRAGVGKSLVDTGRGGAQSVLALLANAIEPTRRLYELAGAGKDVNDTLAAPAQAYDALKQAQSDAEARDKPLMNTKSGLAGNLTGYAAQVVGPGAVLRGVRAAEVAGLGDTGAGAISRALLPESVQGAAAQGGVQGAIQPLTAGQSEDTRSNNAGLGILAGAAGATLPRLLGGIYRGGRALIQPFTESGQQSILANLLQRFGVNDVRVTPSRVPGVAPTLAEATGDANAANLQRTVMNQPGAATDFAERASANNAARYRYLQGQTGTPETVDQYIAARKAGTEGLYDLANTIDRTQQRDAASVVAGANQFEAQRAAQQAADIRAQGALTPGGAADAEARAAAVEANVPRYELQPIPQIQRLTQRPAFAAAVDRAKTLLANQGRPGTDPLQSVDGLQAVKLALDEMVKADPSSTLGQFGKRAVTSLRNEFMGATNNLSPAFQAANAEYARLSAPINAANVSQEILRRGTSAATDEAGGPTLRREGLARALQSGDDIAATETGRSGASAAEVMTPGQQQAFRTVLGDLARAQSVNAGRAVGSNTAQNAISQNLLSSVGAVPGLEGLAAAGPIQRLARVLDSTFKLTGIPDELATKLRDVVLNPGSAQAQAVFSRLTPAQRTAVDRLLGPYSAQGAQAIRETNRQ